LLLSAYFLMMEVNDGIAFIYSLSHMMHHINCV